MASLAEVFGRQLSPQLADLYWDAMKPLAIEQLQASARSWIQHGNHFPKPADLLDRQKEMQQSAHKPPPELPPADRKWLGHVNGMFLRYLSKRRLVDGYAGDLNILARRKECLSLAAFFEGLEAEGDPEATEAEMQVRFDKAMAA